MPRASAEKDDEPLAVGDLLLDRYRIVERMASGGYSVVYRAEDGRLMRPVCVKVFHRLSPRDGAYQAAYEHFVQEAFALSKLTHPNTLRIYDFGYLGASQALQGLPFQVSEYMDRGTLGTLVRTQGPIRDRGELRRVLSGLGGALAEAHQYGIIHRDIKPPNILFATVGRATVAKLADFGIAKSLPMALLSHQAEDTAIVAGRPLVMFSTRWAAPEQMAGQPVGPASDIYSLALVIIFVLTGHVVFSQQEGVGPREQRERAGELIDMAFAGSGLPERAVELLKLACAFDPDARPRDAEELTTALVDALCAEPAPRARPRLQTVPRSEIVEAQPPPAAPLPPRRVHVSQQTLTMAERNVIMVLAPGGTVDVDCVQGAARLRLAFVPMGDGFCIHIKGLSCFVARADGRPSSAAQFDGDGRCELIAPDRRCLASVAVSVGKPAAGHRVFTLGTESIALSTDECLQSAMLDFGAGNECLLVVRPALSSESSRPRPRR